MNNNDVLRSIRYTLDLGDVRLVSMLGLDEAKGREAVAAMLKKEEDADFLSCNDVQMQHFLDALITLRRGALPEASKAMPDQSPPKPERLTNNVILKKLRIAFALREDDVLALFEQAAFPLSRPQVSALFRRVGQSNYRACGDQVLRYFLKGLTLRFRKADHA